MNSVRGRSRLPLVTAVAGTVMIAGGAFWLSFTALTDLAERSGIAARQAWAWPLIVDGVIVVATVAVVALSGSRQAWYPWTLLFAGAGLSVTGNAIHAFVAADADVPTFLAASVAAVPPIVLLAITHLTVILARHNPNNLQGPEHLLTSADHIPFRASPTTAPEPLAAKTTHSTAAAPVPRHLPEFEAESESEAAALVQDQAGPMPGPGPMRAQAESLRTAGLSNKKIARALGVHPSTVGRWFSATPSARIENSSLIDLSPESRLIGPGLNPDT